MSKLPDDFLRLPLAHRALHDVAAGRPENSRAAVRAALAAGFGIEIDVQPSADGRAMVFHDYVLERLTRAKGPIRQRSALDLAGVTLVGCDEGIPTLREILAEVAGRVPVLIEIKDQDGAMGPDVGALEAATASDLVRYAGPVALMSFNPHSVAEMGRLLPDVPRGLTTSAYDPDEWAPLPMRVCDVLREIPDYARTGASFISHDVTDLDRLRVAELKATGAAVLCWTVKSEAQERAARRVADNITFEKYLAAIPA